MADLDTWTWKRNDTRRMIVGIAADEDGEPRDISGCTVRFLMRQKVDSPVAKIAAAATGITPGASGQMGYQPLPGDTDTAGDWLGEFEVTDADGLVETYPNRGWIKIHIEADLG